MDWTRPIDAYCERLGPGLWAEPVNALTNLAFLLAALWSWSRLRDRSRGTGIGLGTGQLLAAVLFVIGLGSGLFHTLANSWSSLADTLPILAFILIYIFAATRDFLERPVWLAALIAVAFLPFAALTAPLFAKLPLYGVSAPYLPVPLLIAIYAGLLRHWKPQTSRGLFIGAGLLMLSLTFRSADELVCRQTAGIGTHFIWHLLNAVMLAWMIETWARHQALHVLAGKARGR
ncbi:Ceramidase [Pseudooceanicola antarcticus]|uniref:Ceramidase n=1 Tax=Pseudooceanicola antarcticus TaxID=1247613 RepID=A0A285IKI7_9RHOB|nr:ceramidase domain-containing protein [Pseudooceanicola antarcticus]PJE28958.1 hypothetical protein CVM39_10915 [Pseudooceanicola antarcticus]SNY47501.1 Ceramidase [Pseudooceanicola antarcticus]